MGKGGSSERWWWGGRSLRDLSKNILKQGWVKANVVRRGEMVLKVSPPCPPQKILIIYYTKRQVILKWAKLISILKIPNCLRLVYKTPLCKCNRSPKVQFHRGGGESGPYQRREHKLGGVSIFTGSQIFFVGEIQNYGVKAVVCPSCVLSYSRGVGGGTLCPRGSMAEPWRGSKGRSLPKALKVL